MTVWVVAGPAGSGKTTLGRALARSLGAALLDLDSVTNPLLEGLADLVAPGGHWNEPHRRELVRPARYAALLATARDQVPSGVDVVLVAPFTAELRGGPEWERLREAVAPATVRVVWLRAGPDLLATRVALRGEPRDDGRPGAVVVSPVVDHLPVDAAASTDDQLAQVLAAPDSGE